MVRSNRLCHHDATFGRRIAAASRRALTFALALCLVTGLAHAPALAGEATDAPLAVQELRVAADASRARIVVHFDREPEIRWFLLRAPHRLVIDLPPTRFEPAPDEAAPRGMIANLAYGNLGEGRSRMIVAADGPFSVERVDVVENDSQGFRLVVDMVAGTEREFEAALVEQLATTGAAGTQSTPKGDRRGASSAEMPGRRFTIVVDPGHGGIDTGARGVRGTLEKTITLAFALELRRYLQERGDYDVHLTRDSDLFLRLDERVRIARQHGADILLSIHADAIRIKGMRGATVYTVSDRASDPEAAAKAIRENLADEVAGIESPKESEEVADILADLVRRETQSFSIRFARSLVGELTNVVQMVNNPHRFAGFRVLRAPDVPSILLELGYLSNVEDEAQMRDPEWRADAIRSIVSAIDAFAQRKLGAGG